ncbi:MAG: hypothetical protein ACKER6_01215 [Candidatus Hodgkinia cicadicola]
MEPRRTKVECAMQPRDHGSPLIYDMKWQGVNRKAQCYLVDAWRGAPSPVGGGLS